MYEVILIRYGEMTLKKKNYTQFLRQMNQNIKKRCAHLEKLTFFHTGYRFYIELNGEDYQEVVSILKTIVGIYSFSLCRKVNASLEEMIDVGCALVEAARTKPTFSFKVETQRSDKTFPHTSIEISQKVAKRILPQISGIHVDVHHPEIVLSIDLRREGTFLYTQTYKGLGGYPSGIAGSGLLMVSGGIDSPVAGFLSIKKGVNLSAIHFASPPYTSDLALQKVIDLLERLALYTTTQAIDLYVVSFADIQNKIYLVADPIYGITLMRRAMYKIASRFARDNKIDAIINGESIGQVASQTLESMRVVNDVTNCLILRPLATYDKEDIIDMAKQISTFDTSIKPYEDCCTLFIPKHPSIKPKIDIVTYEEDKCDLDDLLDEAYQGIKKYPLSTTYKTNIFS